VLVDLTSLAVKFIRHMIHQVLEKIALAHQQILLKVKAVLSIKVLLLQDDQQFCVRLLARLLQLVDVELALLDIKRPRVVLQLECPTLHLAALANEVD
jgi:hypothetical protein